MFFFFFSFLVWIRCVVTPQDLVVSKLCLGLSPLLDRCPVRPVLWLECFKSNLRAPAAVLFSPRLVCGSLNNPPPVAPPPLGRPFKSAAAAAADDDDAKTVDVSAKGMTSKGVADACEAKGINVRVIDDKTVGLSFGESITKSDVETLVSTEGGRRRNIGRAGPNQLSAAEGAALILLVVSCQHATVARWRGFRPRSTLQ